MIFASVLVACKLDIRSKQSLQFRIMILIDFYCITLLCVRWSDESAARNVLMLPFIKVPIEQNYQAGRRAINCINNNDVHDIVLDL